MNDGLIGGSVKMNIVQHFNATCWSPGARVKLLPVIVGGGGGGWRYHVSSTLSS